MYVLLPRFAVWPKVRSFLETFSCGDVMADVGCGNGKYFGVRRDVAILASDRSVGLAEVAATRLSAQTGMQTLCVSCWWPPLKRLGTMSMHIS